MSIAAFCFCHDCDCHRVVPEYGTVCERCQNGEHVHETPRLRRAGEEETTRRASGF